MIILMLSVTMFVICVVWFFFLRIRRPTRSTPFPYTTLFRSIRERAVLAIRRAAAARPLRREPGTHQSAEKPVPRPPQRSEEHTSELQSQSNLVCRLLLEKKKKAKDSHGAAYNSFFLHNDRAA